MYSTTNTNLLPNPNVAHKDLKLRLLSCPSSGTVQGGILLEDLGVVQHPPDGNG